MTAQLYDSLQQLDNLGWKEALAWADWFKVKCFKSNYSVIKPHFFIEVR